MACPRWIRDVVILSCSRKKGAAARGRESNNTKSKANEGDGLDNTNYRFVLSSPSPSFAPGLAAPSCPGRRTAPPCPGLGGSAHRQAGGIDGGRRRRRTTAVCGGLPCAPGIPASAQDPRRPATPLPAHPP